MVSIFISVPTTTKRTKDLGSISKRQFQRRIKNQIQLLNNTPIQQPINLTIQSTSEV